MSTQLEMEPTTPTSSTVPPQSTNLPPCPRRVLISASRRISVGPSGAPVYSAAAVTSPDIQSDYRKLENVPARPTRVFWDLDSAPIAGKKYVMNIINSIEQRVAVDTKHKQNVFEIYAIYGNRGALQADVCRELQSYNINVHFVPPANFEDDSAAKSSSFAARENAIADDLYEQIQRFIQTQSPRSRLYPYILLISGSLDLMNRLETLKREAKIVYAVGNVLKGVAGDQKISTLGFEYSSLRGIDNGDYSS